MYAKSFRVLSTFIAMCMLPFCFTDAEELALVNPELNVSEEDQEVPDGWWCWAPEQMAIEHEIRRSADDACKIWYDCGLWQQFIGKMDAGTQLRFGGYLYTPSNDPLRNGMKNGMIRLEFYDAREKGNLIKKAIAMPTINADSTQDQWLKTQAVTLIPPRTRRIQFVVACEEGESGDGSFFVDDLFLEPLD
jgi:hypothetical protein